MSSRPAGSAIRRIVRVIGEAVMIAAPSNGGVSTIPMRLTTDLIDILKKDSRQALVNFGLNLADAGNQPTRVSIKIKPTILIGAMEIVYPGYFTVKHDFTSGDE